MTPNRKCLLLGLGLLVLLMGGPVAADEGLGGMQLFAPADISPYGRGPQPNEGYFFSFDGLYWSISKPKTTTIGLAFDPADPDTSRTVFRPSIIGPLFASYQEISTLDTGNFKADFNPGQRIEFGRVEGHHGWLFSTFRVNEQTQDPTAFNVPVVFRDPQDLLQGVIGLLPGPVLLIGDLPSNFATVTVRNMTSTWGVELDYLRRMHAFHNGAVCEWMFGVRYLELNDEFQVDATGGPLDPSFWYTTADNHIVAPQVGVRLFKKGASRIMFNAEGRFFAGFNRQNFRQTALLGGNLPDSVGTIGFPEAWRGAYSTTSSFKDEWTPGVEVRAEVRYQMTRAVSIRAGWTGMWMDGIARASNSVNYELPAMGIDASDNRQGLFIHGLTLGVDINR